MANQYGAIFSTVVSLQEFKDANFRRDIGCTDGDFRKLLPRVLDGSDYWLCRVRLSFLALVSMLLQ